LPPEGFDSLRVHQIRFRPGSALAPLGEAHSAPPDHLAGLRGPTSKERGGEGKGEKREEGERKGTGGTAPPLRKFLDPALIHD